MTDEAITIEPKTYQYPNLISDIARGIIKIPAFQRDFVWPVSKTIFLLDSICRRYPIGTFLFWQTTDELHALRGIGNLTFDNPPIGYPISYILDGQQRITSLWAAINSAKVNGQFYRICADLDANPDSESGVFITHEPNKENLVLISDLLGDNYGDIFASLTAKRQQRFNDIRDRFRNYPFSVTLVKDGSLDIVCDIFERINNTGIQLSVFDLLVARTWSPGDDAGGFDLREAKSELSNDLARAGFDELPEAVFAQLAGAIIQHDCTRKEILKITRQDMREKWNSVVKSVCAAVDFVRGHIRVTVSRILPYPSLLVPLSYFFFKNNGSNPDGRQAAWLKRYFYVNGFSGRFTSGTLSKLTEDLRLIDDLVVGGMAKFRPSVSVSAQDIRDTELKIGSSYCKSILCLLSAQQPLNFENATQVILQNGVLRQANSRQFHHIFPKAYMKGKAGADEINSVANIAFIPADLNLRIRAKAPSVYLGEYQRDNSDWMRILESHAINNDANAALENDDFSRFIQGRAEQLSALAREIIEERE